MNAPAGKPAHIVVADDDDTIRAVLNRALTRQGHIVHQARNGDALQRLIDEGSGDILVTDVALPDADAFSLLPAIRRKRPDMPVIVISARNSFSTAMRAGELGAYDYLSKPFDLDELVRTVARALSRAKPAAQAGSGDASGEDVADMPLIGRSPAMQQIYRMLSRLTGSDLTAMIIGESGTGKELVARALHDFGKRRAGPFIAVNMAAIPRELIESELFGHEKGAFTGASAKSPGRFARAHHGTLFLDEIGDMPLEAQTRLLRVLQTGEFTPVGGQGPVTCDVRIVAATNKNPQKLVANGLFREDLFYRLNVVRIDLPPLRARTGDIALLAQHFLYTAPDAGPVPCALAPGALDLLQRHHWPGNVRELQNLMNRLAALYPGAILSPDLVATELDTGLDTGLDTLTDTGAGRPDGAQQADMKSAGPGRFAPPRSGHAARMAGAVQDSSLPGTDAALAGAVIHHLDALLGLPDDQVPGDLYHEIIHAVERPLIARILRHTAGNRIKAAETLGLNRNTLRKKIRELGL